jgi:ceramidase
MAGKILILSSTSLAGVLLIIVYGPIPQDPAYHQFADLRNILGLPNASDVLSNIPFIIVGAWGLAHLARLLRRRRDAVLVEYAVFFAGVLLSGFGSIYYHYRPSNDSQVWDRLPMTIAFMGFFSSVISECIHRKAGVILLALLLAVGLGSVWYWDWTERAGHGDLRPYAVVQYLPMVLIPLVLLLFRKPQSSYGVYIWAALALYLISKVLEILDQQVFTALRVVSGHTLKHLVAAAACFAILLMLKLRESTDDVSTS